MAPALAQDAAAGEKDFLVCRACHQIGPDAKNAVGPVLNGVVGRKAGTYRATIIQPANKDSGIVWTPEELDKYLTSPQTVVPHTKMIFPGLKDAAEAEGRDRLSRTVRAGRTKEASGGQCSSLLSQGGYAMKVRAAVAREAGKPLSLETVDLDGPRAGEVLVEIKATGICHTDEYTLSGADPEGIFPAILGHEGAGIVVDDRPGVTTLEEGRSRHPALHAGMPAVRILPSAARPICAWRSARRRAAA